MSESTPAAGKPPAWTLPWTSLVLAAILPILVFYLGMRFAQVIIDVAAQRFSAYLNMAPPLDVTPAVLASLTRQTLIIAGAWAVTAVVPLLGAAIGVAAICHLPDFGDRWRLGGAAGVLIMTLAALGASNASPPLYKTLSESVFIMTVGRALGGDAGLHLLDQSVGLANALHGCAAVLLLFALLGVTRDFQRRGGLGGDLPATVHLRRLRLLIATAAIVLCSGIVHMVSWRFWPLSMLEPEPVKMAFRSLVEGSVLLHGAVFTALLAAMLAWPLLVIHEAMATRPDVNEQVTTSGILVEALAKLRDLLFVLAPLGTGIAATLLVRPAAGAVIP